MKKCVIVYNPESGRQIDKKNINSLPKLLGENGYDVLMCPTKGPKDAVNIVKNLDNNIDLVICAGGDGTLNECITGNLKRKKKLLMSQLPIGTTNDVGTMYGYNKDLKSNVNKLVNGQIKNVDVLMLNKSPFIYVACVGSYVDVSYNTPRELKKKFGHLGYLFNAVHSFNSEKIKQFDLTYEVDGIKKSGTYSFIFVTNTSRMGGFDNIYNDVKLDDNMFEIALCSVKTKAELLLIGSKLLTSEIKDIKEIEYFKTNKFRLVFDKVPPSFVIDGEEYKHNEKEFMFTINKEMSMLVPNKNIEKLFVEKE